MLMVVHIAAGSTALVAGAVALALRKGSRRHGRAGVWFAASMLVLGATGSVIAVVGVERGTAVIGLLTCYLVATSWVAARHRSGAPGWFELGALAVALACGATMAVFAQLAASAPDGRFDSLPAGAHFPFAGLAAIAAAGDLNFLLRGRLSGRQRTARHLWRMCAAFLIAAMSFFFGQQDEFPEALQGRGWFLPPLVIFVAMIFWIARVRFTDSFGWVPPRAAPAPARPYGSGRAAAALGEASGG